MDQAFATESAFLTQLLPVLNEDPLCHWLSDPNEQADIPHHIIAHLAYSRFVVRGMAHGHDLDDWLWAEKYLRLHRTNLAQLEVNKRGSHHAPSGLLPIKWRESTETRRDPFGQVLGKDADVVWSQVCGSIPEQDKMNPDQRDDTLSQAATCQVTADGLGNLWLCKRLIRANLKPDEIEQLLPGCPLLLVHISTDELYGGGHSEDGLAKGLEQRSLNPQQFQLEPASLEGIDLRSMPGFQQTAEPSHDPQDL